MNELHVFAISHYCEKARWALDVLGVEYVLRHLSPGVHIQVAQQLGAAGSSLPLLVVSRSRVIQGSSEIIAWGESSRAETARSLSPAPQLEAEARAIEQRLDDVAGVHVRRYYYSEALVEQPETVRTIFARDLPASERQALEQSWGGVRQLMIAMMDLGPEQWRESRQVVEGELDWLDGVLADGRRYLVGDGFTRADITAASLLAPLALPREHPTYGGLAVPPRSSADLARWSERPCVEWVRELYRAHRGDRRGPATLSA
jgi:glutathione S-transferase